MTAPNTPLAGRREWLAAMQATLGACGCCLLVAWLAPSVRPWVPLVLSVLWFRGPIGFLLPVGLEPVLMEYGASHPVVAVVAVTAVASAVAETISLRVMRGMASLEALTVARQSLRDSRIVRLFERRPGAAVAFGALSPVPDWITRSLAAVSGYHPARYVAADTLGRLPKLWIPAAAGGLVPLDPTLIRAFLLSQILLVGGVVGLRWYRSRGGARQSSTEAATPSGSNALGFIPAGFEDAGDLGGLPGALPNWISGPDLVYRRVSLCPTVSSTQRRPADAANCRQPGAVA